jgi:methylenetetrahydrofolate reductase (NADPH)
MRICDCFANNRPVFSFEFFPPKTEEGLNNLERTIAELAPLKPSFVSVTYGAGGSTRELTVDLVARIKNEMGIEAMAHLTCVGHSASEIATVLDRLRDAGIENVLALRGDPPKGQKEFVRTADGFGYGSELVRFIRSRYDFCLGAACYPEVHVASKNDPEADLRHLKAKVDAGADFLITQLFFDPADYFRFVDRARAAGIGLPILPGIMPITNVRQVETFTEMCGTRIPAELKTRLAAVQDDEQAVIAVGIDWATEQCRALLDGGAPGIHFYTLNRSLSSRTVYLNLGVREEVCLA